MAFSWSLHTANISVTSWNKVVWADTLGLFVAVGQVSGGNIEDRGRIYTSPDGLTWTERVPTKRYPWQSIAWSGSKLVVVSNITLDHLGGTTPDQTAYSTNGTSWTLVNSAERSAWADITWASGLSKFVAVSSTGTNRTMYSADGTSWTGVSAATAKSWGGIAYNGTILVATAGDSSTTSVMTSTNATSWSSQITSITTTFKDRGISYGTELGLFAAVSGSGHLLRSSDTTTWTDWSGVPSGWTSALGFQTAYISGSSKQFIVTSNSSTVDGLLGSTDGITFTFSEMTDGSAGDYFVPWQTAAYSSTLNKLVVLGPATASGHDVATALVPGISPTSGGVTASTPVTMTGNLVNGGFVAGTVVYFGDPTQVTFLFGTVDTATDIVQAGGVASFLEQQSSVVVGSTSSLTFTTPDRNNHSGFTTPKGTLDILAYNPALVGVPNIVFYQAAGWTYIAPTLTSISPVTGPSTGGTVITLTGTNFIQPRDGVGPSGFVVFRDTTSGNYSYATGLTYINSTTMTCVAPAHPANGAATFDVFLQPAINGIFTGGSNYTNVFYPVTSSYTFTYTPIWWKLDLGALADSLDYRSFLVDKNGRRIINPIMEGNPDDGPEGNPDGFDLTQLPFDDIPYSLLPFDLPDVDLYIYQSDPPPCPLQFLVAIGAIPQDFYDEFVDPDDACLLKLYTPIDVIIEWPPDDSKDWIPGPPPSFDTGWWLSINDNFGGAAYIVENSRPKDPRSFREISTFANNTTGMMGGFPGQACVLKNKMFYAPGAYASGTSPTIRVFDGRFDRELVTIPNTSAGAVPKAVLSMLTADGIVYFSTFDSGTSTSNWSGRVFSVSLETGVATQIGDTFPTGHLPYALAWHMGRLWVGTHRQSASDAGKVYYLKPALVPVWTADYDLATSSVGSVTSLLSYKGLLYVGTTATSGTFAKVLVRSSLGAYTTSDTGTGGTAQTNNAYLALAEFSGKLYASFWNPDTVKVSIIRSFDNTTWSTAYTGTGTTLVPFVGFPIDQTTLLAIGGGVGYLGALVGTSDGTTWTNLTAFLTQGSPEATGLPSFGVVVR